MNWETLLAVGMLGSERQPVPELPPPFPHPQGSLLGAAALVALHRLAAFEPPAYLGLPQAPAPPDPTPTLNPHSFEQAQSQYPTLLTEWIQLAGQSGRRLPASSLPAALEIGQQQTHLRALLWPLLGQRGWWLASQNPRWVWATASPNPQEAFELGPSAMRPLALQQMRRLNPLQALGALQAVWAQETPQSKADLLLALQEGLSLHDESFLESVLDDRSKIVRKTAADLLASLPQSALVQRNLQRTLALVHPESRLLGQKLYIELPAACSKEMQRDGIEAKGMPHGMGEKAWWLQQMVARVPPTVWRNSPLSLLKMAPKEWREVLQTAFQEAAWRFADSEWAVALLGQKNVSIRPDLLKAVAPQQLAPLSQSWLEQNHPFGSHLLMGLLYRCPKPWPSALEQTFLKRFSAEQERWLNPSWQARNDLSDLVHVVPPTLLPALKAVLHHSSQPLSEAAQLFLERLEFRALMQRELSPKEKP